MSDDYIQLVDPYWVKDPGKRFNPSAPESPPLTKTGIDALRVVQYFADIKETYEKVGQGLGLMNIENQVRAQLSPGQSVALVLQKNEKGQFKVDSVERPGKAYLTAPDSNTKIDNVSKPDTSGVCYVPGREPTPNETFKISDTAGKDRELHLDGNSSGSANNTKDATASAPAQGNQSAASKSPSPLKASPPPAQTPKGPAENQSPSTDEDEGGSGGDGS